MNQSIKNLGIALKIGGHGGGPILLCVNCAGWGHAITVASIGNMPPFGWNNSQGFFHKYSNVTSASWHDSLDHLDSTQWQDFQSRLMAWTQGYIPHPWPHYIYQGGLGEGLWVYTLSFKMSIEFIMISWKSLSKHQREIKCHNYKHHLVESKNIASWNVEFQGKSRRYIMRLKLASILKKQLHMIWKELSLAVLVAFFCFVFEIIETRNFRFLKNLTSRHGPQNEKLAGSLGCT